MTTLKNSEIKVLCDLISLISLADNYFRPTEIQTEYIAGEIQKDFSELDIKILAKIFVAGIKGDYDIPEGTASINMRTIYRWIKTHMAANPPEDTTIERIEKLHAFAAKEWPEAERQKFFEANPHLKKYINP